MYWIGLQPGDVHWNISSPGWAKHAWSSFFAAWNAEACVFAFNYARFASKDVLEAITCCGVTTLCAPPTVWRMLVQEPLASYPVKLRELVGAGEPLNAEIIERVRQGWGITIRDATDRQKRPARSAIRRGNSSFPDRWDVRSPAIASNFMTLTVFLRKKARSCFRSIIVRWD
jgi:hypothetical protein